jgi:AraC-like DNA-binding protein
MEGAMPLPVSFPQLTRARAQLCDVTADRAPLDRLAQEAGLSTFQFIRRFHAMFGETPHQMRVRARLEAAKRLLVLDGESVTEACMAVGFASVGSFSHMFTQRYGEPPSAYRRRLLAIPGWSPVFLVPHCVSLMNAAFAAGPGLQFSRSAAPDGRAESKVRPATPVGRTQQE